MKFFTARSGYTLPSVEANAKKRAPGHVMPAPSTLPQSIVGPVRPPVESRPKPLPKRKPTPRVMPAPSTHPQVTR